MSGEHDARCERNTEEGAWQTTWDMCHCRERALERERNELMITVSDYAVAIARAEGERDEWKERYMKSARAHDFRDAEEVLESERVKELQAKLDAAEDQVVAQGDEIHVAWQAEVEAKQKVKSLETKLDAAERVVEAARVGLKAPSGVDLCFCNNQKPMGRASGLKFICWYCSKTSAARAALAAYDAQMEKK